MAMFSVLSDMTIGHWVELGISGVVLVAIGVALWIAAKQFQTHNDEITKRNEDISKREETMMKESLEASRQIHEMFACEQESIKQWMKTQQDVMVQWMQNQTNSINKMLGILNNTALPRKYTPEDEKKNVEFRKFLSQTLDSVRKKTGSSRALFCMFHNGSHSLNNVNFYKFSLIGESWDINLASVNGRIKDCQVAIYSNFLDMMTSNKKGLVIKDVEELKDDVATYQFFKSRGAKCAIVQAVYDENDGMMLGFLVNEFMDLHPEWDEEQWHAQKTPVTRAADRISGVFGASSIDEEIRQEKKEGGDGDAKQ